ERDGEVLTPVTYDQCYAINPEDDAAPEARGNPILTLVLQIDPDSAEVIDAMCLLESIEGVYLTTTSLYFTSGLYEIGEAETLIHQFQLEDGLPYAGSSRLLGGLFLGGNRDYRLNENGGTLRTVLTRWTNDVDDRIDHTLYVLEPASDKPTLSIVGQLPNDQRPDELGKPNEDLYGVRFVGDRGYLVTFEIRDPLYVIDLTDASDPKVAGTLEIPGFSNFLHPVSDSVLMGIGQIDSLAKIEFFDVADLSAPASLGAIALDSTMDYSYSPAEWNRKAFTYWRRAEDQHRMAIPVEGYLKDSWQWVSRLYLFEINNPADPAALTLTTPGYLAVEEDDGQSLLGEQRSILHEDAVFWVIGQEVITSLWGNPSQAVRAK
ncbi:MAG: beta-propeller domain-containing protein, partial [Pseudomonadales bacterium]|nr:beta-propeller domain-containing protein [Pseudomonadales bacterium]